MPGEVAEIALMTDRLGLCDASPKQASFAPVVERAKAGDSAAFEQIIESCQRRVLITAWRMLGNREDARDVAQEVFLRVYKYIRGFRADQDFNGWLYRITMNVCRDQLRRRQRDQLSSFEAEREIGTFDALASNENVEAALIRSQQRAMIDEALNTLSHKERAALVLRDLEGLETAEVARVLGSTQTTVRSQISTARAKIKQYRDRVLARTRQE